MSLCYFVSALHPPRAPCEPEVCVFPSCAVFFLALLMLTLLFFFFSSFPFSILIWTPVFSCGYYAVSSVSVSAATGLAYNTICILIRAYADLTFLFLSEVCDSSQLCVYYLLFLFVFLLR